MVESLHHLTPKILMRMCSTLLICYPKNGRPCEIVQKFEGIFWYTGDDYLLLWTYLILCAGYISCGHDPGSHTILKPINCHG